MRSFKRLMIMAIALISVPLTTVSGQDLRFDLRANLPHAHLDANGLSLDFNDVTIIKYLRDFKRSWVYGHPYKGMKSALPQSIRAEFWVPFTQKSTQKMALDVVLHPIVKGQIVDLFIGGKKRGTHTFSEAQWQTHRFPLKGKDLKMGLQRVKLHFKRRHEISSGLKAPAAFRAVRLSKAEVEKLPSDDKALRSLFNRKGSGSKVSLPAEGGVDYYIVPPKTGALSGEVSGGSVEVWAQLDKKSPQRLETLQEGPYKVSLKSLKGNPARLILRSGGGEAQISGSIGEAGVQDVVSVKPKYVVFWLIDTLRADKLSFYKDKNANGRPKVKTPNLSALAKESTIFEPFYVQGNESKASHASLFTGVYPITHKVYTHKAKLPLKLDTIAELFKKLGYHTGGYVSNGYVSDRWSFDQGFQTFQNFIREGKANNAKAVVKAAKRFIKKRKKKPFYLYLGTSDPHVTYRRHKEFIKQYDRSTTSKKYREYKGLYKKNITGGELGKLKQKKSPPSDRDRLRIEALYENEIAFNDRSFGDLVKALKDEGIYDDTLIIVSSDHGDEFWEHGSCGHGHSLYQELISVPLMIRWPKNFPARRFTGGVDGVDLLPTLSHLMGGKIKGLQGRSVLPHLKLTSPYPQATMASQAKERFALAIDAAKVIYRGKGSIESYNITRDKDESLDLSKTHPILTLSALDPLSLYLSRPTQWSKAKWGAPNALTRDFPSGFPKAWSTPKK
jgi:arylsulfatase A-like enzyme